jgi:hypothetical protein
MKKKQAEIEREIERALQDLVINGLIRPTGQYRGGEMVYEATPEAELSDESRAYAAYLGSLSGSTQVN